MAEGKRYYWLKLKEDFFQSKRIKKLRHMAGGDTYTIIYLKMQLLSLQSDGVLEWTGLEDNFAKELALDLDEKPEDVEITLMYLLSTGLAETCDNKTFLLPWVIENTGSETASTKRVRDFRERKKALTDGTAEKQEPKSNAERQRAFRAKQSCSQKQHIPLIEDHMNKTRYSGNYYIVCQRDHFRCAICDSIENLCVHHIDGYDENKPENNAVNKMVLLCRTCHANVHAGQEIPQDILDAIGYDNVTYNDFCNASETQVKQVGNVEIEIEKEIELEIEKEDICGGKKPPQRKRERQPFQIPTLEEVTAYCKERGNTVDPQYFIDHYAANGWKVGKTKMVDWKAAVRTWERNGNGKGRDSCNAEKSATEWGIQYANT